MMYSKSYSDVIWFQRVFRDCRVVSAVALSLRTQLSDMYSILQVPLDSSLLLNAASLKANTCDLHWVPGTL